MNDITIFMPGRLASERLPNKLILPIYDTNLWEIAMYKLSKLNGVAYVSKNDKQLVEIAKKYKVKICYRSTESSKIDNPLNKVFELNFKTKFGMFVNPCLSFLKVETIQKAVKEFNSDIGYMESVKKFNGWIYKNGKVITDIDYKSLNTKFIKLNQPAHALRVFNLKEFRETGLMLKPNHQIFEIPEDECIDVDDLSDFEFVKYLWGLKCE